MITHKRTQTIMDGLVIRYHWGVSPRRDGEICASRNGVVVQGSFPLITTMEQLIVFGKVLHLAWENYLDMESGKEPVIPQWAEKVES